MKTTELILLAVAAAAMYVIANKILPSASKVLEPVSENSYVDAVTNNALPGQPGYGYSYFEDGTVIGPDGSYYYQGVPVYKA